MRRNAGATKPGRRSGTSRGHSDPAVRRDHFESCLQHGRDGARPRRHDRQASQRAERVRELPDSIARRLTCQGRRPETTPEHGKRRGFGQHDSTQVGGFRRGRSVRAGDHLHPPARAATSSAIPSEPRNPGARSRFRGPGRGAGPPTSRAPSSGTAPADEADSPGDGRDSGSSRCTTPSLTGNRESHAGQPSESPLDAVPR